MRKVILRTSSLLCILLLLMCNELLAQQCTSNDFQLTAQHSGNSVTLHIFSKSYASCQPLDFTVYKYIFVNGSYSFYELGSFSANSTITNPNDYYTDYNISFGDHLYFVKITVDVGSAFLPTTSIYSQIVRINNQPIVWKDFVGTYASGNTLTKSAYTHWNCNGGAASANIIPAYQDGWMEMTVTENWSTKFFGFSSYNRDACYWSIFYNIFFDRNKIRIIENGVHKGHMTYCNVGDVIRLERIGNRIYCKKNGHVFYVFPISSYTNLVADVNIWHKYAQIGNAKCSHAVGSLKTSGESEEIIDHQSYLEATDEPSVLSELQEIVNNYTNESLVDDTDLILSNFKAYPNPITPNGQLKLQFDSHTDSETAVISIFNISGQQMYQQEVGTQLGTNQQTITLDNYSTGVYLLQVRVGEKTITEKVIVK